MDPLESKPIITKKSPQPLVWFVSLWPFNNTNLYTWSSVNISSFMVMSNVIVIFLSFLLIVQYNMKNKVKERGPDTP